MTVESPIFDPLILVTIMANCTTMAWSSPMDPTGTWKQDFLAVRGAALTPHERLAPECARAPMRELKG